MINPYDLWQKFNLIIGVYIVTLIVGLIFLVGLHIATGR